MLVVSKNVKEKEKCKRRTSWVTSEKESAC